MSKQSNYGGRRAKSFEALIIPKSERDTIFALKLPPGLRKDVDEATENKVSRTAFIVECIYFALDSGLDFEKAKAQFAKRNGLE